MQPDNSARSQWPSSTPCLKALGGAPFPPGPPHPMPDSGPFHCPLGAGAADRKPVELTALLYLEIPEPRRLCRASTLHLQ